MKRSRFRGQSDSLDLLLDTICNTFGGIIFIACLVTLLVRETDTGPNAAQEEATTKTIQRHIDVAEADLEKLEALLASQTEHSAPLDTLKRERDELLDRVSRLRSQAGESGQNTGPTPTGDLEKQRAANRPLRDELNGLRDTAAGYEQSILDLDARKRSISKELAALKMKSRQNVRLPIESEPGKAPYWVILKHNRIYLLRNENGDRNTASVEWIPQSNGSDEAKPREGGGAQLPRDAASLLSQLRAVAGGSHYVTVCLFPDSHAAWRDFFRLIQDAGLTHGLIFEQSYNRVIFSSNGDPPPKEL